MSQQTIAHNYALALFEASQDAGISELIREETLFLYDSFKSAMSLIDHLASPGFSQEKRLRIMERALGDTVSEMTRNFILLILKHRRQNLLLLILEELDKIFDQNKRIIRAKLTSAVELDSIQRQNLQSKLEKKTGCTLDIEYEIDPGLIAGFTLVYGDTMFDCSTASALNKFSNTLKSLRYDWQE
ncbi:MAG: ATP synthase F1 subunit delta [Fibrobacter sp.]|nr:ATP synthase F1 subunit delta [Fibrobacter sp.]